MNLDGFHLVKWDNINGMQGSSVTILASTHKGPYGLKNLV